MNILIIGSGGREYAIALKLKNEKNIKKAMLPSYCCDSIIEPFRNAGIEVCFFSVSFDKKIK